jgi:hypothetical protein
LRAGVVGLGLSLAILAWVGWPIRITPMQRWLAGLLPAKL